MHIHTHTLKVILNVSLLDYNNAHANTHTRKHAQPHAHAHGWCETCSTSSTTHGALIIFCVRVMYQDVGYTRNVNGSCAGAVINRYFTEHFPQAIKTSAFFRSNTSNITARYTYRWMTQSWLVSMYRHCNTSVVNRFGGTGVGTDLVCPNATQLADFERVVRLGDIGWHAFPFNAEPELYGASLFLGALNVTFTEDDYYGHAHRTTLSQRDVPGLSRAAIPLLAQYGVKAVSVGENRDLRPVNVPPIFTWRDTGTDTEVLAMFHAGGYGATDHEPEGLHINGDGALRGYPFGGDCVEVPAAKAALCYAWKQDNQGPHQGKEALEIFQGISHAYPNATVRASDAFDDFVALVLPHTGSLPVVTMEIGDTWIQGASADPKKMAWFRAISRARATCLQANRASTTGLAAQGCNPAPESPAFQDFDRLLIKAGEHTWGWDGGDIKSEAWSNTELRAALGNGTYFESAVWTWLEQRSFLTNAVAALPATSRLASLVAAELSATGVRAFPTAGFVDVPARSDGGYGVFTLGTNGSSSGGGGSASIGFNINGAITHLVDTKGVAWAGPANAIGLVWYQGLGFDDFANYTAQYLKAFNGNFDKPGLNLTAISTSMTVTSFRRSGARSIAPYENDSGAGGDSVNAFLIGMAPVNTVAHMERGAPAVVEVLVEARVTTTGQSQVLLAYNAMPL